MLRMVSPAGNQISLCMLITSLLHNVGSASMQLRASLSRYLDAGTIILFGSGRASLAILLRTLAGMDSRTEVLIPAYTCFSVPSAIVRAGLKVRLCDVNPNTLDFDAAVLESTLDEKTLCVVPSNLFGLVSDFTRITPAAKNYGAIVIDDAAQSFGATLNGVKSGSLGDVGVLSLGRGKNITTYNGGVIATNSEEIAKELSAQTLTSTHKVHAWPGIQTLLGLFGYSIFLHPRLYWIPNRLPLFELGASKFDPNFSIERLSRFQCALGMLMLQKLDQLNVRRIDNAQYLRAGLKDNSHVIVPRPVTGSRPIYLRFPILITPPKLRDKTYSELLRVGIGASKMYPSPIHQISDLQPHVTNLCEKFDSAEFVASSMLTLPTHSMVTRRDLDVMIEVVNRCTL